MLSRSNTTTHPSHRLSLELVVMFIVTTVVVSTTAAPLVFPTTFTTGIYDYYLNDTHPTVQTPDSGETISFDPTGSLGTYIRIYVTLCGSNMRNITLRNMHGNDAVSHWNKANLMLFFTDSDNVGCTVETAAPVNLVMQNFTFSFDFSILMHGHIRVENALFEDIDIISRYDKWALIAVNGIPTWTLFDYYNKALAFYHSTGTILIDTRPDRKIRQFVFRRCTFRSDHTYVTGKTGTAMGMVQTYVQAYGPNSLFGMYQVNFVVSGVTVTRVFYGEGFMMTASDQAAIVYSGISFQYDKTAAAYPHEDRFWSCHYCSGVVSDYSLLMFEDIHFHNGPGYNNPVSLMHFERTALAYAAYNRSAIVFRRLNAHVIAYSIPYGIGFYYATLTLSVRSLFLMQDFDMYLFKYGGDVKMFYVSYLAMVNGNNRIVIRRHNVTIDSAIVTDAGYTYLLYQLTAASTDDVAVLDDIHWKNTSLTTSKNIGIGFALAPWIATRCFTNGTDELSRQPKPGLGWDQGTRWESATCYSGCNATYDCFTPNTAVSASISSHKCDCNCTDELPNSDLPLGGTVTDFYSCFWRYAPKYPPTPSLSRSQTVPPTPTLIFSRTKQHTPSHDVSLSKSTSETVSIQSASRSFTKLPTTSVSLSQSNPSHTDSPTKFSSPSFSLQPSPSETLSATHPLSMTPTAGSSATQSPLHTVSLSASFTLSPTSTAGSSATQSSLHTVSMSASFTLTPTITPPPTPTPSHSFSATRRFTETFSEEHTLTKDVSVSESESEATVSAELTWSTEPSNSISTSSSASKEILCGGLNEAACSNADAWCDVNTDGVCFSKNCPHNDGFGSLCEVQGCYWNFTNSRCVAPLLCRELADPLTCQLRTSCRWDAVIAKCSLDPVTCSSLRDAGECAAAGCAYNEASATGCFKPIAVSALCPTVNQSAVCASQGCLWIDATNECLPWDATCKDFPPSPEACRFFPLCTFDAARNRCRSFSDFAFASLGFMMIVDVASPTDVMPGDQFVLKMLGTEVPQDAKIVSLARSTNACPTPEQVARASEFMTVTSYDSFTKESIVASASIREIGSFSFCVQANDTHVLGPFGTINVDWRPTAITKCSASAAYVHELLSVTVFGGDSPLDESDRFALLYDPAHTTACSSVPHYAFAPVRQCDMTLSGSCSFSTTVSRDGNYTVCYLNRANLTSTCPSWIAVGALAPWKDPAQVQDTVAALPNIRGVPAAAANELRCKTFGSSTSAFATHPWAMELEYGARTAPYVGDEVCMLLATPISTPETLGYDAMFLDIHFAVLQEADEIRLFFKEEDTAAGTPMISVPPMCDDFYNKETCRNSGCHWSEKRTGCSIGEVTQTITECPTSVDGYWLLRTLKGPMITKKMTLPAPTTGLLAFACSASANDASAPGAQLTLRRAETYCPNNCKDSTETIRGMCVPSLSSVLGFRCRCNEGFIGEDCSRRAKCEGVKKSAEVVQGSYRTDLVSIGSQSCGFLLRATGDGSMAKWGIAIRIHNASLSSWVCQDSYIALHKNSHDGPRIKLLCSSDLSEDASQTAVFAAEFEDTRTLYLEVRGTVGDEMVVEFGAVSLACPGDGSAHGIPTTDEEKCHGRGTCVKLDVSGSQSLPRAFHGCSCNQPYASTFIGETCDKCAAGHRQETFPACDSTLICGSNCSGHGTCVAGLGCSCDAGWYGLDCELIDDGERLGVLAENLRHRLPIAAGHAGDVLRSGSFDRTILWCAVPGSGRRCAKDPRRRGRAFARQDFVTSSPSHRRLNSNNSGTTANEAHLVADGVDEGVSLNRNTIDGTFPADFIQVNDPPLFGGDFSVDGWVRASPTAHGVLFALVDTAFYTDGRSEPLEHVHEATQKRHHGNKTALGLHGIGPNVHVAVMLNGPQKRIDLLVSDYTEKNSDASGENWLYVRHFRLGHLADKVFDGEWHHVVLTMTSRHFRLSARVFVDGYSKANDPEFAQCVPFLPLQIPQSTSTFDSMNMTSGVANADPTRRTIIWGYRFEGSIDELHVFDSGVSQRALLDVSGTSIGSSLPIPSKDAAAFVGVCAAFLVVGTVTLVAFLLRRYVFRPSIDEDEDEQEESADPDLSCSNPRLSLSQLSFPDGSPRSIREKSEVDFEMVDIRMESSEAPQSPFLSPRRGASNSFKNDPDEVHSPSRKRSVAFPAEDAPPYSPLSTGDLSVAMSSPRFDSDPMPKVLDVEDTTDDDTVDIDLREGEGGCRKGSMIAARRLSVAADKVRAMGRLAKLVGGGGGGAFASPSRDEESKADAPEEHDKIMPTTNAQPTSQTSVRESDHGGEMSAQQDSPRGASVSAADQKTVCALASRLAIAHTEAAADDSDDDFTTSVGCVVKELNALAGLNTVPDEIKYLKRLRKRQQATTAHLRSASTGSGQYTAWTTFAKVAVVVISVFQLLGVLSATMPMPTQWDASFGRVALFFTLDFSSAFNVPFRAMFAFAVALTLAAIITLLVMNFTIPFPKTLAQTVHTLEAAASPNPNKRSKITVSTLGSACVVLLLLLYIPVTLQSFMVLFCHPNISCIYDCYHEREHKELMGFAVVALLSVTVLVPVGFMIVIRRMLHLYRKTTAMVDSKFRTRHWSVFVLAVDTPYSLLWLGTSTQHVYFEVFFVIYRAVMCLINVAADPESVMQFAWVVGFVIAFCGLTMTALPYSSISSNLVLSGSQLHVLLMLLLVGVHMMILDDRIGVAMVALTGVAVALYVMSLLSELVGEIYAQDSKDETDEKIDEEEARKQKKNAKNKKLQKNNDFAVVLPEVRIEELDGQ